MNRAILMIGLAASFAAPSGCRQSGGIGRPPVDVSGDPFAPASIRIHPLTHVEAGPIESAPPGSSAVILHLEVRDGYGDSRKALGTLKVDLYRPAGGATSGMETQALTWSVPAFAEPEANTRRFDQSTRTYRVPLVAPGWVAEWFGPQGESVRRGAPSWLKLRAVLTLGEGESARFLDNEYLLQP